MRYLAVHRKQVAVPAAEGDKEGHMVNVGLYENQAYEEEQKKLADVLQYITEQRIRLEGQMPATAAHQETADAIQEILRENADTLYSALDQPYFGRLDYFHRDEESSAAEPDEEPKTPKTIYLGITLIPGKDVFSWTAPVGRLWYTQSYEDGYTAPRGYIPTRVDLKRYIKIRDRNLDYVKDIFRRQLPAPDSAKTGSPGRIPERHWR